MNIKSYITLVLLLMLFLMTGCSIIGEVTSAALAVDPGKAKTPTLDEASHTLQPPRSTPTTSPSPTITPTPTTTEVIYDIGKELTIQYLRI